MRAHRVPPIIRNLLATTFFFLLFLSISIAQAAQVTLAWDPDTPTPDGYRLFQRLQGGAYDYSHPVWSGTGTTCTISNLSDNTTYMFVVRAYAGSSESGDSNEVSFQYTPPAPVTYALTATAGAGGSISPSGSVSVTSGGSQTFTISPNSGYRIANVSVDGASVGAIPSYTFSNVNANHTISASFSAVTYALTATAGANGSISPSGSVSVTSGGSQTFTISPNSGYRIANVSVDGAPVGAVSSYTFSKVSANHTISASFSATTYTLTATAGTNGSISPSGSVSVTSGGSQTFTISADSGYSITDVKVDGASVGAVSSYTFSNVTANHTISASFSGNQPPVADAGPDQTVDEGQTVVLSGSNSRDMDDGIASMQWRQIQGPAVTLSGATQADATFTAPDVGQQGASLVFELTVTDYSGAQATDTCIVNVSWVNMPPTAVAGPDQTVYEGQTVTLDATASTDPDDGIAAYHWVQVQGPSVTLSDPGAAQATFTAPAVGTQGASLQFELTVTDQGGLQDSDSTIVTVAWTNEPPVADAGPDQQVSSGDKVVLNGADSTDPDDGIATYQWKQTSGPPVALSDPTAIQPFFTAPQAATQDVGLTFQLTVTDKGGLQSMDQCQITVLASETQATDTTPPTVTITNPGSGYLTTSQSSLAIAGTAADNVQVDHVTWSNSQGGSGQATGTTQWQIPEVDLSRGTNIITVTAYDAAGNSTSTSIIVYLSSYWRWWWWRR